MPTTNPVDLEREAMRQMGTEDDLLRSAGDVDAIPLDAKTDEYLKSRRPVLDLLRQAAAMPRADWGPIDGDMTKVMEFLSPARHAVQLTWLAARSDAAAGRWEAAVDDLLSGLAVARHVGQQPLLLCHLVEIGASVGTIDRLAKLLPSLPKEVAAALPAKLDALPPYAGWPAMIDGE
ncbi:MAG TPA: hypothetical protein VF595_01010, partial [Tepidisphaeraceae bacterium]